MDAAALKRRVLRLTTRLDPAQLQRRGGGQLQAVAGALAALDPSADHRLVARFLGRVMEPQQARAVARKAAARITPYTFHFHAQLGWVVWAGDQGCEDLQGVQRVPCVLSDMAGQVELLGGKEQQIRAFLTVGDRVHLRSSPRDWWTVHEFRPKLNSILLIAYDKKKECRKVHYNEVYPLALAGCTVQRSVCVACFSRFLLACECVEAQSNQHHKCEFLFPIPDSASAIAYIESVAEGGDDGRSLAFDLFNGDDVEHHSNDDHVYKMQREAGVRCWLAQKRYEKQIKAALQRLPPYLCNDRSVWLTVASVVRAMSSGSTELFLHWKRWSSQARISESECTSVWAALRPPTNCDEPAILRAREYIQQSLQNGRVCDTSADACSDLMARSIIADANMILKDAVLEYWSDAEFLSTTAPRKRTAIGAKVTRKHIIVPAAVYSFDAEELRYKTKFASEQSGCSSDSNSKVPAIGQFEEVHDVKACISPGCIISLKDGGTQSWYFVLKVDLLFARLRVVPCQAPPIPWFLEESLSSVADIGVWMPVSKVWFALVCTREEPYLGIERYSIFTGPLPDPRTSLHALEALANSPPPPPLDSVPSAPLRILHRDACSVTIDWKISSEEVASEPRSYVYVVSVRFSGKESVRTWIQVYRGTGRGCTISNLRADSCYHIRLITRASFGDGHDGSNTHYTMVHTTAV